MKRWNITLPDDLSGELAAIPNKSCFIAEAVAERLEKQKKEKLDALLIEGYQSTREEDRKINKEWEAASPRKW